MHMVVLILKEINFMSTSSSKTSNESEEVRKIVI